MTMVDQMLALFCALDVWVAQQEELPPIAMEWVKAFDAWLHSPKRSAPATQRAYLMAWISLLEFAKKAPWLIGKTDVAEWVHHMYLRKLSDATIGQRVAAISSFFRYAMYEVEIVHPDGRRTALCDYNPAGGESIRPRQNPYDKASGLTKSQLLALLRAINKYSAQGLRDSALFQLYVASGRRNSEVRTLRKCDIEIRENLVRYHWHGKGSSGWDELPGDIWTDILRYLELSGRPWDNLEDGDYIFVALTDAAKQFKHVGEAYEPQARPLTARTVNGLLKTYARRAGLNPQAVHVHTLRHTTVDLMMEAGFDVVDIQKRLDHKNLGTTQIYITHRPQEKNLFWAQFRAMNGI